jgi:hypothetical protein
MNGVFDAGGTNGKIRLSACRQFGFAKGENKTIEASDSARALPSATDRQRITILQEAFLKPPVFKNTYIAFQGDLRTVAELKQQAAKSKVHPDNLDECINCFIASGIHAQAISQEGDKYRIHQIDSFENQSKEGGENLENDSQQEGDFEINDGEAEPPSKQSANDVSGRGNLKSERRSNSNVSIDLKIDSSMDADKLEKVLNLLEQKGLV